MAVDDLSPTTVLIDGANVLGAGAGGWWRDRAGAMGRLADRLSRYAVTSGRAVELVLDAPDVPAGRRGDIVVHHATPRGRNAADDRIRQLLATRDPATIEVITSDRALAEDVRRAGAEVTGAGTFLARLDDFGC